MSNSLTRKEFYDLLWSQPQTELAKQFDVSDSAIGKAARKAGIPRPGPGYWQKLRHGKRVLQVPLPQRFPGSSDWIHFGSKWYQEPVTIDDDETPIEPSFEESMEEVRARVIKMVGKVSYPTFTKATHSIPKKLLEQDDERLKEAEKSRYVWPEPKFVSLIEKRRLRIYNALFLKMQGLGCLPYMATGKYENYLEASFNVGHQHIRVKLETIESVSRGRQQTKKKPFLKFTIQSGGHNGREEMVWQDDETKLETNLQAIVIELVMAGEQQYRNLLQWRYEWEMKERKERIEKERLELIAAEQLVKEKRENDEKERVNRLLNQAESIRKAEIIREYVDVVLNRIDEIDQPVNEIINWSAWAREQADKIDPIKTGLIIE